MKPLLLLLSICLIITGCRKTENHADGHADQEITQGINQLYTTYGASGEALYNQPVSENLFSPELKKVLEDAVSASKADIERIKKSEYPDDKPFLLEGSVFTSQYEGFTSYKIKKIHTADPSDKSIKADVELENASFSPKTVWTDQIQLIKIDGTWKIDNINFGDNPDIKDLKTGLQNFIPMQNNCEIKAARKTGGFTFKGMYRLGWYCIQFYLTVHNIRSTV